VPLLMFNKLIVVWSQHTIIVFIFVFLHLPPWRWPHEWPKRVGGHYMSKLYHKTNVSLLMFNKCHRSN